MYRKEQSRRPSICGAKLSVCVFYFFISNILEKGELYDAVFFSLEVLVCA